MSYQTWHNYGYGLCVSEITTESVECLNTLLDHAPNLKAYIQASFAKKGITEPTYDDYIEYDEVFQLGLASILSEVIHEAEGIEFTACSNYDDDRYLIYQPSYPWNISDIEATLTEERVDDILTRYVSILTDEIPEIDHQAVENGG